MTVCKCGIFDNKSRGAGMTDVLLAMAICAMSAPFVYNQISRTHNMIVDVRMANKIIASRGPVLNFVRMHAASWPDAVQIKLSNDELSEISSDAVAGFIDKYSNSGATVTDVYLAFDVSGGATRAANIARQIGVD
ncbi:hypothetical protein HDR66_03380, partial [bacterium]|nr:hypothetical protein [bacterium]